MIPLAHRRGIGLMIGAMAGFAVADSFVKLASNHMSQSHTTLLLMGGAGVLFVLISWAQGHSLRNRNGWIPVMWVRYLAEIVGTFGIVIALARVPLSTAGAVMQATPLVVTAGAVLVLGERVSWRQWGAIGIGFLGVMMIVQPGSEGFTPAVLWALLAMVGFAVRDLGTRVTPPDLPSPVLAAYSMGVAVPPAVVWCLISEGQVFPNDINWIVVGLMVLCGTGAYLLLIASIRSTEVSVVSPFRYSRLLFLMAIGIAFFGERPSWLVLVGAAIVVVSGLYAMTAKRD